MELICIGDSLTFGYGVRRNERWTTLAAEESGWTLRNCGVCGNTTIAVILPTSSNVEALTPFSSSEIAPFIKSVFSRTSLIILFSYDFIML